jgi:Large eukaryotic DNA virus major capsid protein/Major capsid protein N-terminus
MYANNINNLNNLNNINNLIKDKDNNENNEDEEYDFLKYVSQQDKYLFHDPSSYFGHEKDITLFKVVYRKHTNFYAEEKLYSIENCTFGSKKIIPIAKDGDLILDITVIIKLPPNYDWVDDIEEAIIKSATLFFGDKKVDQITNDMIHIFCKLFKLKLIKSKNILYIKLPFWFCRNYGLSLPLCTFDDDINLHFEFENINKLIKNKKINIHENPQIECQIMNQYCFLSNEEKKKFKNADHEYLIELFQSFETNILHIDTFPDNKINTKLNFNNSIKELIWVYSDEKINSNKYFNYVSLADEAKITFNGIDRFQMQPKEYFQLYQPVKTHDINLDENIYVFPFCFHPTQHQPTGTINFSEVKNINLLQKINNINENGKYKLKVFALSYNVIRVKERNIEVKFLHEKEKQQEKKINEVVI